MRRGTYSKLRRLAVELAPLVLVVLIPLSVHAGVFGSFISAGAQDEPKQQSHEFVYDTNAQTLPLLKAATHNDPSAAIGGGDILVEDGALVPGGDLSDEDSVHSRTANGEISIYIVDEGDTLSQIAEMFDVSEETILWANDITDPDLIRPDVKLVILPITGIRHVVKDGETLSEIVDKYEGDLEEVVTYNRLASADDVSPGDTVVIPGGMVEAAAPAPQSAPSRSYAGTVVTSGSGSSGFIDPLPQGICSQGVHGYNGVDMAAPWGTPIRAAAGGQVIVSKGGGAWSGGYGNYVVIRHPNGTQTLYAHNSSNAVSVGQSVAQGETVAYVGNTGRSTGNHLHFEVRGAYNPYCR